MANKEKTPQQISRAKYEAEKRGRVLLRVQLTQNDDADKWDQLKTDLVKRYGSAKQGIFELHAKAKEQGEFED